ncbi:NAD-dependent protein deacetylase [Aphelenchoides besseyi]|nr:NAD-dependent protein deacetylase [Aphelenchoides besseyi]
MAEKDDLKNELISDSSNVSKPESSADHESLKKEKSKDKSSKKKDKSPTDSGNMSSSNKLPNLYSRFVHSFENALSQLTDEPHVKPKLESLDLEGVANYIKTKQPRNILFAVGAGISTSAGIPDFRSPGKGLYDNLQKYELPHATSIFELDYFQRRPEPFFLLARELFDEKIKPTPCHYFMRLVESKGYLRRVYTQNIDSLEYLAGISPSKIITAHGSHQKSTCLKCKKKLLLRMDECEIVVPKCNCGGLIKPNITFFGEQLPAHDVFWKGTADDGVYELAKHLGWEQELRMMVEHEWKKIDEKTKKVDDLLTKEKESQKL